MHEGDTEFWKRRFLGEDLNENHNEELEVENYEILDAADDADGNDDLTKEAEDDEVDEEEEVEQPENQAIDRIKDKDAGATKPPQMIGVQLLKDSDQTTSSSRKSKRRSSRVSMDVRHLVHVQLFLLPPSLEWIFLIYSLLYDEKRQLYVISDL